MIKIKKISIKEIVFISLSLSLLIFSKYISKVLPNINGYSFFELYFILATIISITLPFYSSFLSFVLVPFFWLLFGLASINSPNYPWLSFFLEYQLTILLPLFLNLNSYKKNLKNNIWIFLLCFFIVFIKFLIHCFSGVICWNLSFYSSIIFNFPILITTIISTPIIITILFNRTLDIKKIFCSYEVGFLNKKNEAINYISFCLNIESKKIKKIKKIHNGYTNVSFLIEVKNKKWQVRIPKNNKVDWKKEKEIYSNIFNKNFFIDVDTGYMVKEWIEGKNPENLIKYKNQLQKVIENFHSKDINIEKKINFFKYNKYYKKINKNYFFVFQNLIKKYNKDKFVFCHNDINKKNVLISKKDELILIDFEWSQYAPKYFEYAQLKHSENILLDNLNLDKLNDYLKIYLVFSILWTYSMNFNYSIFKLRIRIKKDLKKIMN